MYNENTPIAWGKYKFTALRRIPANYLISLHKNASIKDEEFLKWVADNLESLKERAEIEKTNGFPDQIVISCTKYQYSSMEQAEKHLSQIKARGQVSSKHVLPVRAYKCDKCPFWHLTSKKIGEFTK